MLCHLNYGACASTCLISKHHGANIVRCMTLLKWNGQYCHRECETKEEQVEKKGTPGDPEKEAVVEAEVTTADQVQKEAAVMEEEDDDEEEAGVEIEIIREDETVELTEVSADTDMGVSATKAPTVEEAPPATLNVRKGDKIKLGCQVSGRSYSFLSQPHLVNRISYHFET